MLVCSMFSGLFFFFKQKTAYEMRISDWSSDVCSSDLGSIMSRRGSLSIDDEGTPTRENVLIEDGILKGYMQDRLNARLMGVEPTGNGRRESYEIGRASCRERVCKYV